LIYEFAEEIRAKQAPDEMASINLVAKLFSARIKFGRVENHPAIAEFHAGHFARFRNSVRLPLSSPHFTEARSLPLI
jgi:hypothetical protein